MLAFLIAWLSSQALAQNNPESASGFVLESGTRRDMLFKDGILRLKSRGALRTRQLSSDVIIAAEVNLETRDTEVSIGIRTLHTTVRSDCDRGHVGRCAIPQLHDLRHRPSRIAAADGRVIELTFKLR